MNESDIVMLVTFIVLLVIIAIYGYRASIENEDEIDKLLRKERKK